MLLRDLLYTYSYGMSWNIVGYRRGSRPTSGLSRSMSILAKNTVLLAYVRHPHDIWRPESSIRSLASILNLSRRTPPFYLKLQGRPKGCP